VAESITTREAFNRVVQLMRDGRQPDAEALCRGLLEQAPDDVNLLALLGAILLQANRLEEAESSLLRATEQAPEFARPFEDLGLLHLRKRQPARAAGYFRKAVELDGSQASAWTGLSQALGQSGQPEEADKAYQRALKLSPGLQKLAEASAQRKQKNIQRARDLCNEVLQDEPNNISAMRILADMAAGEQRIVEAEGLMRRIIELAPASPDAYRNLGLYLIDTGRPMEAIEQLQKATSLQADDVELLATLASLLSIVGRSQEALATYERILASNPQNHRALMGRGNMLQALGNNEQAAAAYQACIAAHPRIGDAYWRLAKIEGYRFSDDEITAIETSLATDDLDEQSRINFLFARAVTEEHRGDFAAAWQSYTDANGRQRHFVRYDPLETEVEVDQLIETFTDEFVASWPETEAKPPVPVFVVGMPRSGSTLVEQILASHSQVEGLGELPYIRGIAASARQPKPGAPSYPLSLHDVTREEVAELGDRYRRLVGHHRREHGSHFVDKMPGNFKHVGFIRLILPEARIIDIRKHPLDACVGNYRQLFAQGKNFSYDLQELGEYYLQYARLMDHWDSVLPGQVLRVSYDALIEDFDNEVRRMLDFCALPFEDACLAFHETERVVNTASASQVRTPVYKGAIGYWENYGEQLDELRAVLEPVL
jgi:tetratricopeptide (TPR) repeat protein